MSEPSDPAQPSEHIQPARAHLWRETKNGAASPRGAPPPRKRRQLYGVLALVLALLGATAAWLLFPSPVTMPSFLGAWIDQYDDPLVPPNAWAAQDRDALKKLPWRQRSAFAFQELRHLRDKLKELRDQRADEPVVVFLSAYAATGLDGAVCLLPCDASVADQGTWLPLREVLGALRACKSRHKLLVLDLMRPFTEPRLGILLDDVPRKTQVELEAAGKEDPHLQVLWACAPGQHSLVSEDLGYSAFAYYLYEGLKGRADGYGGGSRDGRVSVRELVRFVQASVDRWSTSTGQPRQTPQFLTGADDFALVPVPDPPLPDLEMRTAPSYPDWLKAKWQIRDAWSKEPWARAEPRLIRQLETVLMRAEQQLSSGIEDAKVQAKLKDELETLEKQHKDWQEKHPPPRGESLARAIARGKQPPDPKAGNIQRKYRDLLALAAKVRADPKSSDKDRERLTTDKEALLKHFADKPFDLAWFAFEDFAGQQYPQDRFRFVASDLFAETERLPRYEELTLVKRLADWKIDAKEWPAAAVQQALQLAKKLAQTTASADDPNVQLWVKSQFAAARSRARAAEELLFKPGEATAEEVLAALTAAQTLCQDLARDCRRLAAAYRLRDDALVRLPGYAFYLESVSADEQRKWEGAVESLRKLDDLLKSPPPAPTDFADKLRKVGKVADTLREEQLEPLQGQVETRLQDLMGRSAKAGAADWLIMKDLLRLAWLEAGERARLWTAARKLSYDLTAKALENDRQEDAARRQATVPPVDTSGVAERERKRALLYARASVALLPLIDPERLTEADLESAQKALARAEREPSAEACHALGQELRKAWRLIAPE